MSSRTLAATGEHAPPLEVLPLCTSAVCSRQRHSFQAFDLGGPERRLGSGKHLRLPPDLSGMNGPVL